MSRKCERCQAWLVPGQFKCAKCGRDESVGNTLKQLRSLAGSFGASTPYQQAAAQTNALNLFRKLNRLDVPADAADIAMRLQSLELLKLTHEMGCTHTTQLRAAVEHANEALVAFALDHHMQTVSSELIDTAMFTLAIAAFNANNDVAERCRRILHLFGRLLDPWMRRAQEYAMPPAFPRDIWRMIVSMCDATTRVETLPRVCRFFRGVLSDIDRIEHLRPKLHALGAAEAAAAAAAIAAAPLPLPYLGTRRGQQATSIARFSPAEVTALLSAPAFYGKLLPRLKSSAALAGHLKYGTHQHQWVALAALDLVRGPGEGTRDMSWALSQRRDGKVVAVLWSSVIVSDGVYRRALLRIGGVLELQLLSEAPRLNLSSADPRKHALLMDAIRAACVSVLGAPPDEAAEAVCLGLSALIECSVDDTGGWPVSIVQGMLATSDDVTIKHLK